MKPAIQRNTEEEEAAIQAGIAADPEARPWSNEEFAKAVPARQVPALMRRVRGQQKEPVKELVSLRLDRDVTTALRATGPGWQTRVSDILSKAVIGEG
jgi:uncharacterized protein (DUF4415 family)